MQLPAVIAAPARCRWLLLRSTWETSTTAGITLAQRGDFFAYASGTVTMSNGILCGSLHPTDIARIW